VQDVAASILLALDLVGLIAPRKKLGQIDSEKLTVGVLKANRLERGINIFVEFVFQIGTASGHNTTALTSACII
jgi:hypothetical protein